MTQFGQQVGVFSEAFHQDVLGTVEGGFGVFYAFVGADVSGGFGVRVEGRIIEQRIGERFEAGFDGDLAFGAALGFIGQIQVFEAGFAVGGQQFALQLRGQFALLLNAFEDGGTTVFHLAQVAQALFQIAQLGVVQCAGDLFAVTGNKRHGGAFIQQGNGSRYLLRADAQFFGKAQSNGVVTHNNPGESEKTEAGV